MRSAILFTLVFLGIGFAPGVQAGECRNDETGEIEEFDGPCPTGWHPTATEME